MVNSKSQLTHDSDAVRFEAEIRFAFLSADLYSGEDLRRWLRFFRPDVEPVLSSSNRSLSPGEQGIHLMLGSAANRFRRLFSFSIVCHLIKQSRLWLLTMCFGRAEM
uniref:(northern house mosquito) hypothetical protein n=1 Tax=Culex pipiens TaxID=7175 RepID=A0A8D8HA21_CULPI